MATKVTAPVDETPEDIESPEETEDSDDETVETVETDPETGEVKRRTRTAMPFGRPFGITVKFHNDLNGQRDTIIAGILAVVESASDGETLDVHRSTRGDPNPNLQTWLIAPYGYDWPESSSKERGVRIPQGKLAEALRRFAAKNDVSMEKAAEMFAEAFGIGAEDSDK
jgi:hypothetical protein